MIREEIAEEVCCVCVHKPTSIEGNTLKGLGCTYGYERGSSNYCNLVIKVANQILSIKGIRLEADNQDKPQNPYAEAADRGDMHAQSRCSGYYCAQDDMLKEGWVKCKVKEE